MQKKKKKCREFSLTAIRKKNEAEEEARDSRHEKFSAHCCWFEEGASRWRGMQGALGSWERLPADRRETGTSALQPQGTEFYQLPEQAGNGFIPQASKRIVTQLLLDFGLPF